MTGYDEEEGRADRLHELRRDMGAELNALDGVGCDPWRIRDDLYVVGPLSVILEWAQGWRSELEELG